MTFYIARKGEELWGRSKEGKNEETQNKINEQRAKYLN